jgi:hypothetical protein
MLVTEFGGFAVSGQMRLSQVTVPLPEDLRRWLEARAQAEDRSLGAQIRHCVASVARQEVSMGQSTIDAHKADITAAEAVRQTALAQPGLTQAQAKAADVAYLQARLVSALQNSISPSVTLQALKALGAPLPSLPSVVPHLDVSQLPPFLPPTPEKPPEVPPDEPVVAAAAAPVEHAEAKPSGAVPPVPPRRPPGR